VRNRVAHRWARRAAFAVAATFGAGLSLVTYGANAAEAPTIAWAAETITVTGIVEPGAEADCLLVKDYLLVAAGSNGLPPLRPGTRVTVTGTVDPGRITICQQGIPLIVETVQPA